MSRLREAMELWQGGVAGSHGFREGKILCLGCLISLVWKADCPRSTLGKISSEFFFSLPPVQGGVTLFANFFLSDVSGYHNALDGTSQIAVLWK